MHSTRALTLIIILIAFSVSTGFSSCETPLLDNYGFDLWCGDQLCGWEVEAGEVRRVPTWHERDSGAELVGTEVTISQLSELTPSEADCFVFDLVADAEEGVELLLEMDFMDDGQVEYSHPIDARHWHSSQFAITPPEWFEGVRFRIRKLGEGRAVLAHVYARSGVLGEECLAAPLDLL